MVQQLAAMLVPRDCFLNLAISDFLTERSSLVGVPTDLNINPNALGSLADQRILGVPRGDSCLGPI